MAVKIASDVAGQIGKGISLVLSDRVAHCQDIHGRLLDRGIDTRLLTGDMPDRERKAIVAELHDGHVKALVSTCALCGEGFDLKSLGSIFLTTPVKFSGRTKQYIGRILRTADGKQTPTVYDYVDDVGILQAAHRSRLKVYQEMGVIL